MSDGLIGVASTRTTTSSSFGTGTGTRTSESSTSPSALTVERSSSPVAALAVDMLVSLRGRGLGVPSLAPLEARRAGFGGSNPELRDASGRARVVPGGWLLSVP